MSFLEGATAKSLCSLPQIIILTERLCNNFIAAKQASTQTRTTMNGSIPSEISQYAFAEIVKALSVDMPLIMHGSGDARIVNPETVQLLSELTANYISNLVDAAVDSQEILNDGQRPPLPPPPLVKNHRTPSKPERWVPPPHVSPSKSTASKKASDAATSSTTSPAGKKLLLSQQQQQQSKQQPQRKRHRSNVEYWDEPLDEPKIRGRPTPNTAVPEHRLFHGVSIDDWTGVAGVDFFEQTRVRTAHVALPVAIGTQNFIFPVCHDQALYGKILDIQTSRRSIEPVLADPAIQDIMRREGALLGAGALRKRRRAKKMTGGGGGGGEDEIDSESEELGASWPGLEDVLPLHTTQDFLGFLG
jgi:hypothetical protein